ncbi:uncharacterized membrane protein (DUF485 family) [Prauserella isguenensis]|uniref:Uncharacterized membrane protein (DUF485 family) n=1 Tax=Prauserella isguenensis TaxID=1470180 RepID=A0A839RXH5_9PSEU|nr:hypothetical protein [Prauserella isguenensis]MBB3049540.1 uncharacterized membrane protein (DUF485 family) [Prauserella isguenensis]
MTVTTQRAQVVCRAAFIVTLLVFLAMAAVLVGVQLAGVVLMQAEWVSWAAETLLTPSITAGVAFGLVGFVSSYVMPKRNESADA